MKNRSAQGKKYELEVIKILESEGWTVERAINKTLFLGPGRIISVAHDFFSIWDIIAVRVKPRPAIRFVQVTVWEEISHKVKKIAAAPPGNWELFNCAIYCRMRNVRPLQYRIAEGTDGFKWTGKTVLTVKEH